MRKVLPAIVLVAVAVLAWIRRRESTAQQTARPADVRFMYAMHNAFRRDLARLERASAVPSSSRGGWEVFREELEFHHRAEDEDLWPALRVRTIEAQDQQIIDDMVAEHARLTPALDDVARALNGEADAESAVDTLVQLVREHLDHEEADALPIIERYFTDADWHRYMHTERRKRGRKGAQFLTWVLDDAEPSDAATVLHELPPPARLVYRFVLKPRYDARQLWRSQADRSAMNVLTPSP
jgi:hypothetical protein